MIEQLRNDCVEAAAAPRVVTGIPVNLKHVVRKASHGAATPSSSSHVNGDATEERTAPGTTSLCQVVENIGDHI